MQAVSSQFSDAFAAMVTSPQPMCMVSWKKTINDDVDFFTLDSSHLDGGDILQGTGDVITLFDKYDYQDETQYVQNFSVSRKISNRPWGVIMAQATITLNNTTKRFYPGFDPDIGDYTALPGRPVKLGIGVGGEFMKVFTGYTDRPDHQLVKRLSVINAFDAMTYLSTVKSTLPAFVDTSMSDIVEQLLIEQGFGADQYNLEPSLQLPIGYLMPTTYSAVTDIFNDLCTAEGYLLFVDENGIIQGWNRLHLLGDRSPVAAFTYSTLEDISWSSSSVINSADVVAKPFKPAAFNKLWELAQASDTTLVPPGASIDIIANFQDDNGAFPAISVDEPVYVDSNAGSSTYSTNLASDGSADAMNSYITLSSVYNFGNSYRMTFTNSHTSSPIYITNIQLFGQPAKVTAIQSQVQQDTDSIEKYGINPDNNGVTYELDNNLIQDTAAANTMAWLLVNLYSTPHDMLNLSNFIVPQIQLGDPVQTTIEDTGEVIYGAVMGIDITFGVSFALSQKLYVQEMSQHTYFRLDISHLDGSDGLAL